MASTQKFSVNLGLSAIPETRQSESIIDLYKIYAAIRNLAGALDSYTGALQQDSDLWSVLTPADTIHSQGPNRLYVIFSETVAAGEICTLWDNAGVLTAKKAGGNPWAGDARGYATGAYNNGDYGEIILFGLDSQIVGVTPGATYYLSNTTAGSLTATKPSNNGDKIQVVGYGLTSTTLFFCPFGFVSTIDNSLGINVLVP